MFVARKSFSDVARSRSSRFADLLVQFEVSGFEKTFAQWSDLAAKVDCQLPGDQILERAYTSHTQRKCNRSSISGWWGFRDVRRTQDGRSVNFCRSRSGVIAHILRSGTRGTCGTRGTSSTRGTRLHPQQLKILAAALRAFGGCPVARKNVLLDDDPTVIVDALQFLQHRAEIHSACAELAK